MSQKIYTVAIIGVGSRGADAYGNLLMKFPERFKIVSLCDLRQERLNRFSKQFGVNPDLCFLDEKEFFKEKRADLLIIATLDKDHVRQCLKAFELGYDIMMEKPITDSREECLQVLAAQKKYGGKALVCHVLRYAPAFLKIDEILQSGAIGKLVAINATEQVCYWHQAHSYVRGNWRRSADTTPMILAKCCHDLDLLQFYVRSKCKSVSSVGNLVHFKKENAPEGAAERCVDCKYIETCPYSAKTFYIDRWKQVGSPENNWPYNVIAPAPSTEEKLMAAIQTGPYGRCVFRCDNDVVDHQITQMTFENGVKATLTMTAFTAGGGRRIFFYGTEGELVLDEEAGAIHLKKFGHPEETIALKSLVENGFGHGGGDFGLVNSLYDMLEGKASAETALEASIESHLIGICAEESRLQGGKLIFIHE